MLANVEEDTQAVDSDNDDAIVHTVCDCNEYRSICGIALADEDHVDSWTDEDECIVCVNLPVNPCQRCSE